MVSIKPLHLSYGLTWRTEQDEKFRKRKAWKRIRSRILLRDDYTCCYCGIRSEEGKDMTANHIDGNPKNNDDTNLEAICLECLRILHAGFWGFTQGKILLFRQSKYNQNDIVKVTRDMRAEGKRDEEIIKYLGLNEQVPWAENLEYLSELFGFISSKPFIRTPKPYLTEEEQRRSLDNRLNW